MSLSKNFPCSIIHGWKKQVNFTVRHKEEEKREEKEEVWDEDEISYT